jgi:hypothetical protein
MVCDHGLPGLKLIASAHSAGVVMAMVRAAQNAPRSKTCCMGLVLWFSIKKEPSA